MVVENCPADVREIGRELDISRLRLFDFGLYFGFEMRPYGVMKTSYAFLNTFDCIILGMVQHEFIFQRNRRSIKKNYLSVLMRLCEQIMEEIFWTNW